MATLLRHMTLRHCPSIATESLLGLLTLAVLLSFFPISLSFSQRVEETFAFTGVTVIDGTGGPPKAGITLIVKGDRIAGLSENEEAQFPKDAKIIESRGKFVIPGLWDMHVHTADQSFLSLYVANGVTAVRDVGMNLDRIVPLKRKIQSGEIIGPRMFVSGPIIDGPHSVLKNLARVVQTPDEARSTVKNLVREGIDFIKVYNFLSPDAFRAVVDEAHKLGVKVAGHVPLQQTTEEASRLGLNSIEHLTGVLLGCSDSEHQLRDKMFVMLQDSIFSPRMINRLVFSAPLPEILETFDEERAKLLMMTFAKNETWHVPTLFILRLITEGNDAYRSDPRLKRMPAFIIDDWEKSGWTRTPEEIQVRKRVFQKEQELVLAMHKMGIGLLMGTDTPNPYVFPGSSVHEELREFVAAGIPPLEALQYATRNPARYFGLGDSLGTIELGKKADLVFLDENPLVNIENTKKIWAVVCNGRFLSRSELNAMVAQ